MEVWRKENEIGLGDLVRVELDAGHTHFQAPEALDVRYAQAIREFCQQEGIRLPYSFQEYEQAAAQATFVRMAEEHQTLDILASREALRSMPDGGYGYEYSEGYNPYTGSYVCQQCSYMGQVCLPPARRALLRRHGGRPLPPAALLGGGEKPPGRGHLGARTLALQRLDQPAGLEQALWCRAAVPQPPQVSQLPLGGG